MAFKKVEIIVNAKDAEYTEKKETAPAFLRHMCMSATRVHLFVSWLNDSTLFLTRGPSCPPTAYRILSRTPTPRYNSNQQEIMSFSLLSRNNELLIVVKRKHFK